MTHDISIVIGVRTREDDGTSGFVAEVVCNGKCDHYGVRDDKHSEDGFWNCLMNACTLALKAKREEGGASDDLNGNGKIIQLPS